MELKQYKPSEKQQNKWQAKSALEIPSDEEFMTKWKKSHHGKVTGWGIAKRDFARMNLKNDADYNLGLWQGRLDWARGLSYTEDRLSSSYNMGYHQGYGDYTSDYKGWDQETRDWFTAQKAD